MLNIKHKFLLLLLPGLILGTLLVPRLGYAITAQDPQDQNSNIPAVSSKDVTNSLKKNPIITDINNIIKVLSAGVGIIVTGSIIVAGIQYAFAGDNSQMVSNAKHRIVKSFIALIVFMFIFAFIQWIVPGGLFSS
jgi:hypothetical protein